MPRVIPGLPGRSFRDCAECPAMVAVPAGSFAMGTAEYEEHRTLNAMPQRKVTIARSFALGKYEVTFAEWDVCVAGGGCRHRPDDRGWGRGNRPVIDVSWDDAQAYVAWLSRKTGKRYRLPSEAEWEYASRAGTTTAYSWGPSVGRGNANCDGCGSQWDRKQTAPVGSFAANRFGLHDMSGNVREWVEDCWHHDYRGAPRDGMAWTTGSNCESRVVRGGSWNTYSYALGSAARDVRGPRDRIGDYGFRVARTF